LQQAAFDDCVYAVDVMRNVAVKQGAAASTSATKEIDPSADEVERKFSLPARMLCQTSAALLQLQSDFQNDSSQAAAVAGRLEIRMVDPSTPRSHGDHTTDQPCLPRKARLPSLSRPSRLRWSPHQLSKKRLFSTTLNPTEMKILSEQLYPVQQ
jgi:hypothetical protein